MKYLTLLIELVMMPFILTVGALVYPLLYCADKWVAFLDLCFNQQVKVVPAKTSAVKTKKKPATKKSK